jgi:hypothetical protein
MQKNHVLLERCVERHDRKSPLRMLAANTILGSGAAQSLHMEGRRLEWKTPLVRLQRLWSEGNAPGELNDYKIPCLSSYAATDVSDHDLLAFGEESYAVVQGHTRGKVHVRYG